MSYEIESVARSRTVKPAFFTNEDLSEIHPYGRLLFIGLWTLADREGRLKDIPRLIAAQLFPFENKVQVDKLLTELDSEGFITRYEVGGDRFIQIMKFEKHQRPHSNEPVSEIPPISEVTSTNVRSDGDQSSSNDDPLATLISYSLDQSIKVSPDQREPPAPERSRRRPLSQLDEALLASKQDEHPGINVGAEFTKFSNWLKAKNKTFTDYVAAFDNWLLKAEEYASVQRYGPARNSVGGESKIAAFARREGLG